MKITVYLTLIIQVLSFHLFAQEFQFKMLAQSNGSFDIVTVGFDPSASIEVDSQFGEEDIYNAPFDSNFEVKVGQVNWRGLRCDTNFIKRDDEVITYMSKVDIAPRDCNGYDIANTINGLTPISTLFIRNSNLPVTLKWDRTLFENECLEKSIITDWWPGGWFDVVCPRFSIDVQNFVNQDSLVIDEPSSMFIIDSFSDTLSLFHIALGKLRPSNVNDFIGHSIEVYPNPTTGLVQIESNDIDINSIEVYDVVGNLVQKSKEYQTIDLESQPNGIYFLRINSNGSFLTKRIIRNGL